MMARYGVGSRCCRCVFASKYKVMNELSKGSASRLTIDEETAGQRIDNFLLRILKGVPKSHVYRILRSGEVRINSGRAAPDARLATGDVVRVPPVRLADGPPQRPAPSARVASRLPVLFEDEHLLVVNKPAGIAVHGGSGIVQGVIESLRVARPQARFLELVHRLDRDTSGVLVLAKKRAALVDLHAQIRDGAVDKRYLVLVRGKWRDDMRRVQLALHRFTTKDGERRVRVDPGQGQAAATVFRRVATWPRREVPLALLEAELLTGRTHQIRVHLAHVGYPVAGDAKYGDYAWNRVLVHEGLRRMFLHARRLAFVHPATAAPVAFEAPLPDELATFIATLGASS